MSSFANRQNKKGIQLLPDALYFKRIKLCLHNPLLSVILLPLHKHRDIYIRIKEVFCVR